MSSNTQKILDTIGSAVLTVIKHKQAPKPADGRIDAC